MANELWSYYQTELVNSQELNDQVNQLQQEHAALQEQHANELKMVREEKTQLQQQHARELHQLQGGQQQQPNVAKAWMDKAASLEQELEQLKYQKSVIKRQRDLFAEHCQCWQRRSPSTLIESVIEFVFLLCILRQLRNWLGGQPPGPPPGPPPAHAKGAPGYAASGCGSTGPGSSGYAPGPFFG